MSAVTGIFWFCFFFFCYPLGNGSVVILIIPTERKKKKSPTIFFMLLLGIVFCLNCFSFHGCGSSVTAELQISEFGEGGTKGKPSSSLLSTLLIGQRLKACFKICVCNGRSRKKNWVWLKVRRFSKTQLYILSHQKQGIQFIKHNCFQTLLE